MSLPRRSSRTVVRPGSLRPSLSLHVRVLDPPAQASAGVAALRAQGDPTRASRASSQTRSLPIGGVRW